MAHTSSAVNNGMQHSVFSCASTTPSKFGTRISRDCLLRSRSHARTHRRRPILLMHRERASKLNTTRRDKTQHFPHNVSHRVSEEASYDKWRNKSPRQARLLGDVTSKTRHCDSRRGALLLCINLPYLGIVYPYMDILCLLEILHRCFSSNLHNGLPFLLFLVAPPVLFF